MTEKECNNCLYCDCYDGDMGCTMSSIDEIYACPDETQKCEYSKYTESCKDCGFCEME